MTTITFDNGVELQLALYETATEEEIREQVDYEVAQGWHSGVTSSNSYTWENN